MKITGKDILATASNTSILGRLSSQDVADLGHFMATPAGRKLMRLSPIMVEEIAREGNAIIEHGRGDVQIAAMEVFRSAAANGKRK